VYLLLVKTTENIFGFGSAGFVLQYPGMPEAVDSVAMLTMSEVQRVSNSFWAAATIAQLSEFPLSLLSFYSYMSAGYGHGSETSKICRNQ